jgi:hypothetical protein
MDRPLMPLSQPPVVRRGEGERGRGESWSHGPPGRNKSAGVRAEGVESDGGALTGGLRGIGVQGDADGDAKVDLACLDVLNDGEGRGEAACPKNMTKLYWNRTKQSHHQ